MWDLPTRVFHWTLVTLIICAWVSNRYGEALGDPTLRWHRWNGLAILVLIVFRVLWGVVGSSTSRFSNFVRWPWVAAGYGLDLLRGRDRHFLGHNPLGTWMILALLAMVALQATLGLFTINEDNGGLAYGPLQRIASEPWVAFLSKWHVRIFYYGILALVAAHITANVLYGVVKQDPLIRAMITGRKPRMAYEDEAEAKIVARPIPRALVCLVVAAALVFGTIIALGGKL